MTPVARKRRDVVLAKLYEQGHVAVKDLATSLDTSESTVRRLLHALADDGQLELVHGGAVLPRVKDFSFNSKSERQTDAKRVIGRLAAELVSDGDQILVDSGTTALEILPFLKSRQGLSVIVNSSRHAMELNGPGISTILLGGQYRPDRMDTIGPMALTALDQLRGFMAFIGVDGLSMDFGLTASDIDSAHLYRLAIRNAREAVLVADHSKFLTPSLYKIVDFDAVSRVITDRPPSTEWADFLSGKGITVICPDARQQSSDPEAAE